MIYYQAGVFIVLTSSVLSTTERSLGGGGFLKDIGRNIDFDGSGTTLTGSIKTQHISASADFLRHRIYNLQILNTIELNSTVYFCRAKHNEFNYSSNPTYFGSQVK